MQDQLALALAAGTLLIIDITLIRYWLERNSASRHFIPITAGGFLFFALGIFALFIVGIALVGAGNGLVALQLALGLPLSLLNPTMAVSYTAANLLVRPWESMPHNSLMGSMAKILVASSLLSWVLAELRRRSFAIRFDWPVRLFVLTLCWFVLSAGFAFNTNEAINFLFESMLPVIVVFLLIVNALRDEIDERLITSTIAISVTGIIAQAIVLTLSNPIATQHNRLFGVGLTGNANDLGALIVIGLPFVAIPLLRHRGNRLATGLRIWAVGVLLFGLWLTQSRGAMLSVAVAGACYVVVTLRNPRRAILPGVMLLLFPLLISQFMTRDAGEAEMSSDSRWHYVETGVAMVKRSPVFGVGPGNYPALYNTYASVFYEWGNRTAHSTWVLTMSETGLPGLAIFSLFVCSIAIRAWRARQAQVEYLLAFVGYSVAMSFLSHTYILFPYLLYAVIVACCRNATPGDTMAADHTRGRQ